jgi:hypothetical protein
MLEVHDRDLIVEADATNPAVQQAGSRAANKDMRQLGGMVNGRLTGARDATAVGARITPILLVI